ncbi:unnamed protein product [Moneuplotes crassus]|uniref:Uncharacterized protein n=1 Tax=Euplotes crassus TaxID=5936 RepID=A0AAD2D3L1_EUPCR|nr:unnamed protein product [Moneuplotes crassus]
MNHSLSGTVARNDKKVEFESLMDILKKQKEKSPTKGEVKKKTIFDTKSSGIFSHRRSSEPQSTYREPWRATKKIFESFDKDNYWYTGNVRADIIYKSTNMLPRSYKDDKLDKKAKPFRNPARNPDQIKEKAYLTKIGRMALKKRIKESESYYKKKLKAEKEYFENRRYLLENMGKGTIDPPFLSARNSTINPSSIMSEHNMYFKPGK